MQYPHHLLPKQNYKIIPYEPWMNTYHLLRHTQNKELRDPETGLLKLDYIVLQTDHLRDLSTNLLGTFTPEDCFWSIKKEPFQDYFGVLWEIGEEVKTPDEADCDYLDHRGAFYLKIEDCAGNQVKSGGQDEITVICDVLHTPVRCNFWHFSLRWKDEHGEYFNDLKPKRIRNFFRSWVRKFIQDRAIFETPEYVPVPVEKYVQEKDKG
ncbi:MAG: hypothetical protein R2830_11505 [Saprospiraceae bacterium]